MSRNPKAEPVHADRLPPTGTMMGIRQRTTIGPLPASDEYRAYGEVLPSAPERILRMAEREQEQAAERQKHSMAMDVRALDSDIEHRTQVQKDTTLDHRLGQVGAVLVILTALVIGGIVGGWYGAVLGALGPVVLACALLFRKSERMKEQEREAEGDRSPPTTGERP